MTKRILMVEDTEDNRQIVRDLLDSVGYELIEAHDGAAGVAMASEHKPDLILMDIQLPGARRLRGDAPDQGRSGAQAHPDHRGHLLRALRRRGEDAGRRLRRLRRQALQPAPAPRQDQRIPGVRRRTSPCTTRPSSSPSTTRRRTSRSCACAWRRTATRSQTAADGEEGLARARELEPDLILLDIMMPKLDGICGRPRAQARRHAAVRSRSSSSRRRPTRRDIVAGPRRRRRRLSDQAVRARGAARPRALDAAPEGAARHRPGPGARSSPSGTPTLEERVAEQVDRDRADRPAAGASCRRRSPT